MASLILTLENGQRTLKIIGDCVSGWGKKGFLGRGSLDYVNDTRLVVLLDVFPPKRLAHLVTVFPKDIQPERGGYETLYYRLSCPQIEVFADLEKNMGTLTNSGKPGFVSELIPISKLWLKLTVHIQSYQREAKVTWEHDVLPFLPGGQFESKRSRH